MRKNPPPPPFADGRLQTRLHIYCTQDEIEAEANAVTSPPREVKPKDAVGTSKTHSTEVNSKPSKRKKSESGDSASGMKEARGKTREPSGADKKISKPNGRTTGSCRGGHIDRDGKHEDDSLVCVVSSSFNAHSHAANECIAQICLQAS